MIFYCLGTHIIGTKITFPRSVNGSCLRATRLPVRTITDKRNVDYVCSIELLKQLHHPIPPRSIENRNEVCLTTVSGTENVGDILRDCLVEPLPAPPLSQVLSKIDFDQGSKSEAIAVAALIPGILKHERAIDIDRLHVSLGHAHDEILRQTAKQHGIRLTGELVSCSACSKAKGQRASTPHRMTRRAMAPRELVHIDTAGPYPATLEGSRYVVMFVDMPRAYRGHMGLAKRAHPPSSQW